VGKRLFDGDSDAATINQILNGSIAGPSALAPTSSALDPIVLRALQFKPESRFATALEFAQALESTGLPIASHRAVGEAMDALCGDRVRQLCNTALHAPSPAPIDTTPVRAPSPSRRGTSVSQAPRWWLVGIIIVSALIVVAVALSARLRSAPPAPTSPLVSVSDSARAEPAPSAASAPLAPPNPLPSVAPTGTAPSRVQHPPSGVPRTSAKTSVNPAPSAPPNIRSQTAVAPSASPAAPASRPRARPSEFRPQDL
jgi:hypothetical protein